MPVSGLVANDLNELDLVDLALLDAEVEGAGLTQGHGLRGLPRMDDDCTIPPVVCCCG